MQTQSALSTAQALGAVAMIVLVIWTASPVIAIIAVLFVIFTWQIDRNPWLLKATEERTDIVILFIALYFFGAGALLHWSYHYSASQVLGALVLLGLVSLIPPKVVRLVPLNQL